ncbi:unnamed protein product [Blepharisma stoltei]|uniref:Kinesin motor domain-containing protein n=1 Tax=Blepharisma stoltei TaxID=1481888 RepID=A0AAU9JP44_9CILI|nr:unnamed protein product [Blepharisma stoltei]
MPENDNVKVAVRVRPQNTKEREDFSGNRCLEVDISSNKITLDSKPTPKPFIYDFVGDEDITQEEIFEVIGMPIASSCLAGYNGTIFAYGQTGAGKTFTILGPSTLDVNDIESTQRGLLPRSIEFIFSSVKKEIKRCSGLEFLIKCSFLEIYNEQINDLLSDQKNLQVREDVKKGVYVDNLQQETVANYEETLELLYKGIRNRHVGATSMNKESSRSHSVFTLAIESKEKQDNVWNLRSSLFHLIDLAGSERQKSTETMGERLKEAGMINKSLSVLGNVINSLVDISEGKNRHVHYRDSKLTFLLKDSLGGNSKTCIIANVSSSSAAYGETLSTLRFAERAKMVKNSAIANVDTLGTITELREEIKKLQLKLKEAKINSKECSTSDYSLMVLNDRVKEFESLLEQNMKIRLQSESALQNEIGKRESYIKELMNTIEKYENKIESDKMIIKFRQDTIQRLQKEEKRDESAEIQELKEEIAILKRENENHHIASKLFVENQALKDHIRALDQEIKEDSCSLRKRLRENQEFSEKLQLSLKKSAVEREQLRVLLNQYASFKGKGNQSPHDATPKIEDLSQSFAYYLNAQAEKDLAMNPKANETMLADFEADQFDITLISNLEENVKPFGVSQKDNKISDKNEDKIAQDKIFQKFIFEIGVLNDEIANKEDNIRDLETKISKQNQEIQELKKENSQFKDMELQFAVIEEDLLKAKNSLDWYEEELDSTRTKLENLNEEIAKQNKELQGLKNENAQYKEMKQEFALIENEFLKVKNSYEAELGSAKAKIEGLSCEIENQNKEIIELKKENSQYKNMKQEFDIIESDFMKVKLSYEEELKSSKAKLESLSLEISKQNQEIEALKKENSQYQNMKLEFSTIEKDLMKAKNYYEEELGSTKNQLENLSSENVQVKASLAEAKKTILEQFSQISALNKEIESLSFNQSAEIKEELEGLKNKIDQVHDKNKKLNEELKLSLQNKENMIYDLKNLQKREIFLTEENESYRSQLESYCKDNERLKAENANLSKELAKLVGHNNLNQKIKLHERMKEESNKLKEQNYSLREELRKKTDKLDAIQKRYDLLKHEIEAKEQSGSESLNSTLSSVSAIESQAKEFKEIISKLAPFVPENINEFDVGDEVVSLISKLQNDLLATTSESTIREKELQKQISRIKLLESENLLMKHQLMVSDD